MRQHLDSFNDFIENTLQEIVDEVGKVTPDIPGFYVKFGEISVSGPWQFGKQMARRGKLRLWKRASEDLTYAREILLKMTPVTIDERNQRRARRVTLEVYVGKMPIMLKSNLCPLSKITPAELIGGVKTLMIQVGISSSTARSECLVTQEDLAPNRIMIEDASWSSSATHIAKVFSTTQGFRDPVHDRAQKGRHASDVIPVRAGENTPRSLNACPWPCHRQDDLRCLF